MIGYKMLLAFLWTVYAISAFCKTYYVSPLGNNSNSGLSPANAFRTLQKAANTVIAGDSVLVSDSTYAGFDLRTSGTASKPILFKAIGNQVIINRRNQVTSDGINIENADWITIYGFQVINQPRAGIRAALANHITISHNICLNNGRWGIFTGFTDNFIAEYNECAFSIAEHGIYVSNSSDSARIRFNKSHDNRAAGLHFNGDISQGGDGINHGTQVYGNILYRNGLAGGAAINMDGNQNAWIYNNLLYDNLATGIAMFQIDGGGPSSGGKIIHNTIVMPKNGRWGILLVDGAKNTIVKNNIIINQHPFRGSIDADANSLSGLVSDYNILTNRMTPDDNTIVDSTAWKVLGFDVHSYFSPNLSNLFKNANGQDYSLVMGSKAINFGTNQNDIVMAYDLNGSNRIIGSLPDAGALEFSGAPLPLHWIKVKAESIPGKIIVEGTIADLDKPTTILLVSLHENKTDTLSKKELSDAVWKHVHFEIPVNPGLSVLQMIAVPQRGIAIYSQPMNIDQYFYSYALYPNPATNHISLHAEKTESIQFNILDVQGRIIRTKAALDGTIDLNQLFSGQYYIQLIQNNVVIKTMKFTKL